MSVDVVSAGEVCRGTFRIARPDAGRRSDRKRVSAAHEVGGGVVTVVVVVNPDTGKVAMSMGIGDGP